jgi:hypothetical protein
VPVHAVDALSEGAVSHPTEPSTGSAPHHPLISGGAEPADAAIVAHAPGRAHGHPPRATPSRLVEFVGTPSSPIVCIRRRT